MCMWIDLESCSGFWQGYHVSHQQPDLLDRRVRMRHSIRVMAVQFRELLRVLLWVSKVGGQELLVAASAHAIQRRPYAPSVPGNRMAAGAVKFFKKGFPSITFRRRRFRLVSFRLNDEGLMLNLRGVRG